MQLGSDIRQAFRSLAKAPAFALAVTAVLALGIGSTTAIFSIVYAVVLKPLPFPQAARIVAVRTMEDGRPDENNYLDVKDWRAQTSTLDGIGVYATNAVTLTGAGDAVSLPVAVVGGDFFQVLGIAAARGRVLTDRDDDPGAPPAAVLSDRLWRDRFAADGQVVGRGMVLDGKSYTVVGVMPARFEFPFDADRIQAWIPIHTLKFAAQLADQRGAVFLDALAKLRPGRTAAEAHAELDAIQRRLAVAFPQSNQHRPSVDIRPLQQIVVQDYRLALVILLAAVGALLLIACANVASLLLARGAARRKEIAIRAALGASRGRLAGLLLVESVVLALAGGVAGTLVAFWGVRVLVAATPVQIPRLDAVSVDGTVLLFALLTSVATALLFGTVPALQLSRASAAETLRSQERGATSAGATRVRRILVVAELAVSVVLLVSAGLLARTFLHLQQVRPGFAADHAVGMFLTLPDARYANGPARAAFADRLLRELLSEPGVESAAIASTLPMSGSNLQVGFSIAGRPVDPAVRLAASMYAVSGRYFETMRVPILRGRAFTERDGADAPPVVIVGETLARQYWPGEDPIGRRIAINYKATGPREIVGIVADVKNSTLSEAPRPQMYTPFAQTPWPFLAPVVRTSRETAVAAAALRAALARVDPLQAAAEIKPLDDYLSRALATPRFTAALIGGFALLALLLASIGLYGLIAFSVAQRQRELGIRMALGASDSSVKALVLAEAARLGAIGLLAGLAIALASTRVLGVLLVGVTAADPLTFASIASLLILVLLAAAYLPARRATRVDPVIALRSE